MEPTKPNDHETNPTAPGQPGDAATFRQRRAEWETWDKQQTRRYFKLLVVGNCIATAVFWVVALSLPPVKPQNAWFVVYMAASCIIVWLFLWPIAVLHWKNLTRWWRKTGSPKVSL